MKWTNPILGIAVMVASIALFSTESEGIQENVEWSVTAECRPHSQVTVPQFITVRLAFSADRSGPRVMGWMSALGDTLFESTTQTAYWGTPQQGWLALIFEGPVIHGAFFCQTTWENKNLHLFYEPAPKLKVFLSPDGRPSSLELDTVASGNRSVISVHADFDGIHYTAGTGSTSPYWLQLAVPVYNTESNSTVLHNEFF